MIGLVFLKDALTKTRNHILRIIRKQMKRPRLEIDASGHRYLTVWYSSDRRDFTEIIEDAFKFHKIDEKESVTIPVIVLPINKKKEGGHF